MRGWMQKRVLRTVTLILLVFLIVAISFLTIPFGSFRRDNALVLLTFAVNGVLWLLLLIAEVNKRPFSFRMIHWSFCLLFFFFAALVQYSHNYFPWVNYREDTVLTQTNLLLTLWTGGVCLGGRGERKKRVAFAMREINDCRTALWIVTILSIGNTIYRISDNGLLALLSRATSSVVYGSSSSMALLVGKCFQALPGIATALAVVNWRKNRTGMGFVAVNLLCLLISYFPTSTARYVAAAIYLGLLLIWSVRLKKGRGFILLFLGAFMVLLPFLNAYRNESFSSVSIGMALRETIERLPDMWLEGDYDAYSMLTMTVEHVKSHGTTWGRQLLGVALFWVPRALWPNKPIGSGALVATARGFSFTNLSSPLPAEGLINFGVVGVFLFAFVCGRVMAALDGAYWDGLDRSGKRTRRYDILYPFICIMFFFVSRGDLLSSFAYMVAYVAVWIGVCVLLKWRICWKRR